MQHIHKSMEIEDASSKASSDDENDSDVEAKNISETKTAKIDHSETDSNSDSEQEADEETDFWSMLIKEVVEEIYTERKAAGKPGFLPYLNIPAKIAEGKYLSQFIRRLRLKYTDVKKIHDAACTDSVIQLIENEVEKIKEEYTDPDDSFPDETQEMAWKKYKPLIKKKIFQNLDEFRDLVCGQEDVCYEGDSESDGSMEIAESE